MKMLMHTCCAPCSVSCVEQLRSEGIEPTAYWFNPNIHPYQEYKARRDALIEYSKSIRMELIVQEDYGLRSFVRAVATDIDHRCEKCYEMRLEQAARFAAENGFDSFTSTLFVSPYQQHDRMAQIADQAGHKWGVEFLYRDFCPGFRAGQQRARELGLYMQKYCGCIFSEEDRYGKPIRLDQQEPLKHFTIE